MSDVYDELAKVMAERDVALKKATTQQAALEKINAIRNSIIGTQQINWSAHIYPLVAALNEAGQVGQDPHEAAAEAQTLFEQRDEYAAAIRAHWRSPWGKCAFCKAEVPPHKFVVADRREFEHKPECVVLKAGE